MPHEQLQSPPERSPKPGSDWVREVMLFGAWVALGLNMLKGIRAPGRWAATHVQFDWSQGFLKRSLVGTLLKAMHLPVERYAVVTGIAALFLGAAFAAVAALTWRARVHTTREGAAATLLMTSSFAVALMAHLVGYFDHILVALSVAGVAATLGAKTRGQEAAAAALCAALVVVGLLTHEVFLVFGTPLLCVTWWLRGRWGVGAALGALAIGLTIWLMERGVGDAQMTRELIASHKRSADFALRPRAYLVFERDSAENLRVTEALLKKPERVRRFAGSLVTMLPVSGLLLYLSVRRIWADGALGGRARRVALALACAGVALSSHGLILFGWDMHRWHAQSVVSAFLVGVVVSARCAARAWSAREVRLFGRAAIAVVLFNTMAGFGFFDGYSPQPTPYLKHVKALHQAVTSGAPLIRPPKH